MRSSVASRRLRGQPSVSLLPHIRGIKRMPTKNGQGDRPRRAIPWSQVRFALGSPLEGSGFEPSVPLRDSAIRAGGAQTGRGSGCALQQKQLAFDAQQLGNRPAFFGALRACVRLLDHDEPVGDLPGTARGSRPRSRSFITVCQPREVYSSRAGHGVCWQWRSGARTLRRWHWPAEQAP